MTGPQIIVLATPVFFLLIGLELAVGLARGRNGYRLGDALSSIGLGVMSQIVAVFTAVLTLGIYATAAAFAPWRLPADSIWTWLGALVAYDFLYYWHHRAGHRIALLWAAHVVHHQSEDYNLSTALRQTSSGFLLGWIFYLPMAFAGVPPLVFGVVALIDLLYQFWVHTEQIGRLGWFDRWFCAPSNHRVHHAVNDEYLDCNFGGILIVWDRIFGTHAAEDPGIRCIYGTRAPLASWNPVAANVQVYAALLRDARHLLRWRDRLALWFRPPGWWPEGAASSPHRRPFAIEAVRRYDPAPTRPRMLLAGAGFIMLLGAATLVLWHAHEWPRSGLVAVAVAIGVGLCAVAALLGAASGPSQSSSSPKRRMRTRVASAGDSPSRDQTAALKRPDHGRIGVGAGRPLRRAPQASAGPPTRSSPKLDGIQTAVAALGRDLDMSHPMTKSELDEQATLGALKPVDHAILAFPDGAIAGQAKQALLDAGFPPASILDYTSRELFPNLDEMMRNASGAAGFGYEVVLMRRYMSLAVEEGVSWLIVHSPEDEQTAKIQEIAKRFGARSAVRYGHLMHEDLV